jgi:hypothetical protein
MTNTVFYKKQGRRYIPISEYSTDFIDAFPYGSHLVTVIPGVLHSRAYKIDPAFAPMIAAGRYAKQEMTNALLEAARAQPQEQPLTQKQLAAWDNFLNECGGRRSYISYPSANDIIEAGLRAMQHEADKTMQHPTVKAAWEQFMLVYELTKQHNSEEV